MLKISWIKKIYIDRKVERDPFTRSILDKLPGIPVEVVGNLETIQQSLRLSFDPVGESKKVLFLTAQKSFVRPCPCSPGAVSCGYWTIDLDINCPLDCSYCILQAYFEQQPLTIAINRQDLKNELIALFNNKRDRVLRIGTGELGDSLALDELTENSLFLVEIFKGKEKYYLELKTKTDNIEKLLQIKTQPNVILSWSLNTEKIIEREEKGAASLEARLKAAVKAINHGYRVGFHFDPVIYYPGWEQEYQQVINKIFAQIPAEAVTWISLGTLRFPVAWLNTIRRRFPEGNLFEQEFIKSGDGKYRYPRFLRLKIYERMLELLSDYLKTEAKIYLCMETAAVWKNLLEKNKRGRLSIAFPFPWLN